MAVELSFELSSPTPNERGMQRSLAMWAETARMANEPCVVVDSAGDVFAASPGCGDLFEIDIDDAVGRPLAGEVLDLRDFSGLQKALPAWEINKTPPLLAISSKGLTRGLLRVWVGTASKTVDAISVPLVDSEEIVGSLTFFVPVNQ